MRVYVETNFVLELALVQEEARSCRAILDLCTAGRAELAVPAYSLAEPFENLIRRHRTRKRISEELDRELHQLSRTEDYADPLARFSEIASLLQDSVDDDWERLAKVRSEILECARVIPLTAEILISAATKRQGRDFSPQDSLVYASVLADLEAGPPGESLFLNRNTRDFDDPGIVGSLKQHGCLLLPTFRQGLQVLSRPSAGGSGEELS